MRKFSKSIVVISKCIEFEPVRWNAQIVSDDFVRKMKKNVIFLPVCPEVEIGLGVPRETLRIVKQNNELKLVQPATGLDLTKKIKKFSVQFLSSIAEVDGFILKSGSSSSGFKGAKI